jgi:hypothetical protein
MLVDCNTSNLSSLPSKSITCLLFFFSKTFIEQINTIIRRFWWAGIQEEHQTNPIPFRSWNDICQPTNEGGLGIRNMEIINQSLIIQSAWNVATNKNPFLSAILKSKYFPDSTFWTAPTTGFRSTYWSSILQVKHHLHNNTIVQVHKGNSSIWSTPWNPYWEHMHDHLLFPITINPLLAKISDLWLQDSTTWDHKLLSSTFDPQVVQAISSL